MEMDDALVSIAIGALAAIFVGSFIGLLVICRRQQQRRKYEWERFDNGIIQRRNTKKRREPELAMALSDIGLGNALDQILKDEQWVDDATGLIPYTLAVLRTCHKLTERLATLAMGPIIKNSTNRLIEASKRIPSRVDDVVQAMYPPLDPRLLEARVAALVLAVGQLGLLTQTSVGTNKSWIDQSLQEMDEHLLVLRKASIAITEPKRDNTRQRVYV